jgi:hypothetical protein
MSGLIVTCYNWPLIVRTDFSSTVCPSRASQWSIRGGTHYISTGPKCQKEISEIKHWKWRGCIDDLGRLLSWNIDSKVWKLEICFVLDQHTEFDFYCTNSLKQQSTGSYRNVTPPNNENEGDVSTIPQESDESGTIKILNISMMYLYTEFPDIGTCRILWYFLREHNYESLN